MPSPQVKGQRTPKVNKKERQIALVKKETSRLGIGFLKKYLYFIGMEFTNLGWETLGDKGRNKLNKCVACRLPLATTSGVRCPFTVKTFAVMA